MRRFLQVFFCAASAIALVSFVWTVSPPTHHIFWDSVFDTGHILIFGLVAVLGIKLMEAILPKAPIGVHYCVGIATSLALGIAVEIYQYYQPHRTFEFVDLFSDLVGVLAFPMLYASFDRRLRMSASRFLRPSVLVSTAMVLFVAGLIPLLLVCGDYRVRNSQFPVLLQFSRPWYKSFVVTTGANLQAVSPQEWPAEGRRELVARLDCRPGKYRGIHLKDPYPDWTGYDTLEIDIFVPKLKTQVFVFRVHDRDHNHSHDDRFNQVCRVVPGFQTLQFDLRDIETGPRFRELDMKHIAAAILFIVELEDPFAFYVGEMRLTAGTAPTGDGPRQMAKTIYRPRERGNTLFLSLAD